MSVTADACRQLASQLARAQRNAAFGGEDCVVSLRDPGYLVAVLRRAARELERAS